MKKQTCTNCQADLSQDHRFCPDCGLPLIQQAIEESVSRTLGQRVSDTVKQVLSDRMDQRLLELETVENVKKRISSLVRLVAALVGVVCVVFFGSTGWSLYSANAYVKRKAARIEKQLDEQGMKLASFDRRLADAKKSIDSMGSRLPTMLSTMNEREGQLDQLRKLDAMQRQVASLTNKVTNLEKVTFEPSEALTPEIEARLRGWFTEFRSYLREIGRLSLDEGPWSLRLLPRYHDVLCSAGRIVIGEPVVNDRDFVLREYASLVLQEEYPGTLATDSLDALSSGLADYFTCSFGNDPRLCETYASAFPEHPRCRGKTAVRNLDNRAKLGDLPVGGDLAACGEVWGATFWQLRCELGNAVVDRLLLRAWQQIGNADAEKDLAPRFAKEVIRIDEDTNGGANAGTIRQVFSDRGVNWSD